MITFLFLNVNLNWFYLFYNKIIQSNNTFTVLDVNPGNDDNIVE